MRIGSLFSGAGGLDMAVEEVFGGTTVWHSEIDKAASKVLAYRWPDVPNLGDITQINWANWKPMLEVDVLCGGWPCQPFSLAGKQKGINDDRALWPYVSGAIRVLRPRFICLENVPAVLTAGEFDRVASDLASFGYRFAWQCLRASDIGAPHQRERFFLSAVADTDGDRLEAGQQPRRPDSEVASYHGGVVPLPNTPDDGRERGREARGRGSGPTDSDHVAWGRYELAVRRWEQLTRPAPSPFDGGEKVRLNPEFASWMMGWPEGWVTAVPGITRSQAFRCIGNGVCPQQAQAAYSELFRALLCGVAA